MKDRAHTGNESVLPPITELAEHIRDGHITPAEICTDYGVAHSTLVGRFSIAGYSLDTGEPISKHRGQRQSLESQHIGVGGQYVGGRDWTNGLPTREAPARHRGGRRDQTGLNWDQINADYTANGGRVDNSVWHGGKVVVVGAESRNRLHTFTEATADGYDYDNTLAAPSIVSTERAPAATTIRLTPTQQVAAATRYRDGLTIQEVADEFGVSYTAIRTALTKQQEPIRARQDSKKLRTGRPA